MAHNTAYWYGKQYKELRQLLFPGLLQQQEFCYFLLYELNQIGIKIDMYRQEYRFTPAFAFIQAV